MQTTLATLACGPIVKCHVNGDSPRGVMEKVPGINKEKLAFLPKQGNTKAKDIKMQLVHAMTEEELELHMQQSGMTRVKDTPVAATGLSTLLRHQKTHPRAWRGFIKNDMPVVVIIGGPIRLSKTQNGLLPEEERLRQIGRGIAVLLQEVSA